MLFRRAVGHLMAGLIVTSPVVAAGFPDRPVRLVIPYPAGGTTDVMARAIQDPLAKVLGQPIIIDNRGGAAGAVATREVSRAAPDGYTLLFSNEGPSVIAPLFQSDAGYDPVASFAPISLVSTQSLVLVANGQLPVADIKSLVEYAKKQPQPLMYASAGSGSLGHLSTELFARVAGIPLTHVPYRGSAPTTLAVMRGEVQLLLTSPLPLSDESVREGKLKLLGVSTNRPETLPAGVAAISQTFPAFQQQVWFGILAPKNTPHEVIETLNKAIAEVLASPEVGQRFERAGFSPTTSTPAEFEARIAAAVETWRRVIAESNIKPE